MNRKLLLLFATLLFLPALASAQLPDTDGDGVPDVDDACPAEDASFFDADGDGCIDELNHARHIEYWATEDLPFQYVVHEGGAPLIDIQEAFYAPGQEIDEVVAGMELWEALPNANLASDFAGTTPDSTADGTDGINQITFRDPDFLALFGNTVIAVGLTTSFTEPSIFDGRNVRPGQIVDADMLFNPSRAFSADTSESAVEVRAVAVHEAGHLFGLNHSALPEATMFPALPAGFDATTLETDDVMLATMSYPSPASLPSLTRMSGTIIDGATGLPIPGAAVFALPAGSEDKVAVQFTLPDGTWEMADLPAGAYDVFVAPLNGGADVFGVVPGFINALVDSTAQTLFVPDFYDAAEGVDENPADRTPVDLVAGTPVAGIDIITNADNAAPFVVSTTPVDAAVDALSDGVVLIRFSEPVAFATVSSTGTQRFRLLRNDISGPVGTAGQLTALGTRDVLVFTPSAPLQFDATYTIQLDPGIEDRFGNATTTTFEATFAVEARPPLSVTSVSPQIAVDGAVLVVSGAGFDAAALTNNTVTLGSTPLAVQQATPTSLVVQLPSGTPIGQQPLNVATTTETLSGAAVVEVVEVTDTARATEVTSVPLAGLPNQVVVLPDLRWTLAATGAGVEAMVAEGSNPAFGTSTVTSLPQGLDGIAVAPTGIRAYGVSRDAGTLIVIDTDDGGDPGTPLASFLNVLAEIPTGASPTGIAIDPTGREAYVTTAEGSVQVWDLVLGGGTSIPQIGDIALDATDAPFVNLKSSVDFSLTGDRAYVIDTRALHVIDTASRQVVTTIPIGAEPADVAESPLGELVYVSDLDGHVSVIPVTATSPSQVIDAEASLRGLAIGPTGGLGYATDRRDEEVAIIDFRPSSPSFRTVIGNFTTGEDPIDVAVSPDGSAVYTVSEGSQTLNVFGIGFGPIIDSIFPAYVSPGDIIAVGGSGYTLWDSTNVVANEVSDMDFAGTLVGPSAGTGSDASFWLDRAWARVPQDFTGGPIRVVADDFEIGRKAVPTPDRLSSNPAFVTVFTQDEIDATSFGMPTSNDIEVVDPLGGAVNVNIEVHPKNAYAIVDDGIEALFLDLREDSPTFLTVFERVPVVGPLGDGSDDFGARRAFTPDGKLIYTSNNRRLNYFDADPNSATFGQRLGVVDFSSIDPNDGFFNFSSLTDLNISPDGRLLFIGANLIESTAVVALTGAQANTAVSTINFNSGITSARARFHPSGRWAYFVPGFSEPEIVDLDPFSSNYLQVIGFASPIGSEDIEDVAFDPKGRGLWAVTRSGGLGGQWNLWWGEFIDDPSDVEWVDLDPLEISTPSARTRMELHPNGLRAAITIPERRIAYVDLSPTFGPQLEGFNVFDSGFDLGSLGLFAWDGRFTPDGKRYVGVEQTGAVVRVSDYSFGGIGFSVDAGQDQVGVIGQALPGKIRVRTVNEGNGGEPGVPLRIRVTAGGGTFDGGLTERIIPSDANGAVDFTWTLGPNPGTNTIRVESLLGFGVSINAQGVVDPSTIPLALVQILPATGATGVSATSAASVQFSRAVNRASVPLGTITLRDATSGDVVTCFQGFSDGDRRVSLIPIAPLAFDREYVIDVPASVADLDGNTLGAATSSTFVTQTPPAPVLIGMTPPAGTVGSPIILSGIGFDPAPGVTTVTLNGAPVSVTKASVNSLRIVVPNGATTGPLDVAVNSVLAGSREFTVLQATTIPVDEVDDDIELGVATQALAVLPNGLKGYAVSTSSDQVIPVDLIALTNGTPIAVGSEPAGAVSDVDGAFVYVANRGSNSVSVIDTATDTVVDTILLQDSPEQILASPNGDYIYAVTPTGQAVEVVDVDATSATYNTVTARFGTGTSTTGGTMSPDGTILYLGTDDGFLTVDLTPTNFGVTARFGTGTSTTGGTVSPDGTLLFLFTTTGEVLVIDVDGPGYGTVTARFGTGTSTTGGTVSPDGTILYVISSETDEVLAFAINVSGQVSSTEGLFVVDLELLDRIDAGDDPRWITFDPRDPTVAFVGATGDLKINVFGRTVVVDPPTCEAFDVVFGTSWDPEPSLQEIFDAAYGVGAIDAATDYEGYECDDAAVPYWLDDTVDGWIIREIGDYRGANVLGWYAENFTVPTIDGVDDGVIFDGGDPEGSVGFVGLNGPTRFGLYLNPNGAEDAINAPEPELFFTNRGYNDVGPDGSGPIHAPDGGDPQALIYDVTALRGGVPTYVIAWEDVDSGAEVTPDYSATTTDNDFNDLVIEIRASSPVRAVVSSIVAVPQADGVRVAWNVSGGVEIDTAVIERRSEGSAFEVVAQVRDGDEYVDGSIRDAGDYVYRVAVFVDGGRILSNEAEVSFVPQVVRTGLTKAYPNPFNPRTNIEFAIARPGDVKIKIYDVAGRLVKSYELGEQPVGTATVQWTGLDDKGRGVSSGVYLIKLITPDETDALRVVLLK